MPASGGSTNKKAPGAGAFAENWARRQASSFVQRGETVLDLGSGSGKICFIASQVVGPAGKVIGVDANDDMLRKAVELV
mgnify:CR=1 FL=1